MYFETSAVSGQGVAEAFSMIANVMAQSDFPQEKKRVVPKPVVRRCVDCDFCFSLLDEQAWNISNTSISTISR